MTDLATLLDPARLVDSTQPLGPVTTLPAGLWHLEGLIEPGTPARVFAILPPDA